MTELYHDASAIAQHMTEVLRTITTANGYYTDIGAQRVFRGRRKIDDNHVPCAVLVEGDDKVIGTGVPPNLNISQSYVVGGYVKCDPDNPNDAAHLVIKDLKKAFFAKGNELAKRVRKVEYVGRDIGPRADGEAIVFAVVHIDIEYVDHMES